MTEHIDWAEVDHIIDRARKFVAAVATTEAARALAPVLDGEQEDALHALMIACDEHYGAEELDREHAIARGAAEG